MQKIEHATAAKVSAERDGTTVVIVGRVPDVERARDMIEDLLAKNGIDFAEETEAFRSTAGPARPTAWTEDLNNRR